MDYSLLRWIRGVHLPCDFAGSLKSIYQVPVVIMDNLMKQYLNPKNPGGLGGVERFFQSVPGKLKDKKAATRLLQEMDPYSVNKESRKKFSRNKIVVTNMQHQYQMDLADMKKYQDENEGVKYILFAIDCFSRKASTQPLLSKEGVQVRKALEAVFAELGQPNMIQVDKGEFFNAENG